MANITFSDETKKLIRDFFNNTEDFCLSDYRKPDNPEKAQVQDNYFQIIRKDNGKSSDWRKIDFHFEVQYNTPENPDTTAEEYIKNVFIFAFLSTNKKTVEYFRNNNAHPELYSTVSTYYVLKGERIPANFSTVQNTKETLEKIAEILSEGEFKRLGNLADDLLKNPEV